MRCVIERSFDTEIFGVPFYRLTTWDEGVIAEELRDLTCRRPIIIDAKIDAEEIARKAILQRFGFRTICTQIVFRHDLVARVAPELPVTIGNELALDDGVIQRHSQNFRHDRFSIDSSLPREARDRLFAGWIANSLAGEIRVATHGANFCSFREEGDAIVIDLLSVLEKRRGIARSLVAAVLNYGAEQGKREVRVVTECANRPAWQFYLDCGFAVHGFLDCLHFVAL